MKTTPFNSTLVAISTLLVFAANILASTQTDIVGPAGSEMFGTTVTVLPNGNFVVTDPFYDATGPVADVGRVYLYNGTTLALINTMTGTAANDGVGSNGTANPVTVLPNGDYIVCSSGWNGQRGAVTRCSPTTGCPSTINSSNSLVGSVAGDFVGQEGIVVLPNGNFVVRSSQWNNGATTQAGALTWFAAAATPTGNVTTGNSRYGGHSGDQIGLLPVVVLSNSNYVTARRFLGQRHDDRCRRVDLLFRHCGLHWRCLKREQPGRNNQRRFLLHCHHSAHEWKLCRKQCLVGQWQRGRCRRGYFLQWHHRLPCRRRTW